MGADCVCVMWTPRRVCTKSWISHQNYELRRVTSRSAERYWQGYIRTRTYQVVVIKFIDVCYQCMMVRANRISSQPRWLTSILVKTKDRRTWSSLILFNVYHPCRLLIYSRQFVHLAVMLLTTTHRCFVAVHNLDNITRLCTHILSSSFVSATNHNAPYSCRAPHMLPDR